MVNKFIKSPLNYTGNKHRILSQMLPYFPSKIGTIVDLFCGGATVGLNVKSEKTYFIDCDEKVIGLLNYFANVSFCTLIKELDEITIKYRLSRSYIYGYKEFKDTISDSNLNNGLKQYNSDGFYKLRADYNALSDKASSKAFQMLYILMLYGFNNDMRFSRDGNYNLPIGKTDLNLSNVKKLKEYIERIQEINAEFICGDFESVKVQEIIMASDFTYMDPPYLITNAVYNESNKWNEDKEYALLNMLGTLLDNKKQFVLSNVLTKKGKRNEPLYYWTTTRKSEIAIIDIDYHYRSASYNKINRNACEREVIILPKDNKND